MASKRKGNTPIELRRAGEYPARRRAAGSRKGPAHELTPRTGAHAIKRHRITFHSKTKPKK